MRIEAVERFPTLRQVVLDGTDVEKQNYAKDQSFTQEQAAKVIDSRPY